MNQISQVARGFSYETFHKFFSKGFVGLMLLTILLVSLFQPLRLSIWEDGVAWPFIWGLVMLLFSVIITTLAYFFCVPKYQKRFKAGCASWFYILTILHLICLGVAWGVLFSGMMGVSAAFFFTWLYASHFYKGGVAHYSVCILNFLGASDLAHTVSVGWKAEIEDNLLSSMVYSWLGIIIIYGCFLLQVLHRT